MPEIAQATITVTPVLQGAQQTITDDLTEAAEPAGLAAGKTAGTAMTKTIGETMSSAGDTLTKGLTAPIAAISAASVAAWKDVDEGLDIIVTKTGASGDALEDMQGILEEIATTIPTDFATAGSAIGEVNTRFGLTGDALRDLSEQFVMFADINGQDVSNSVDSVSKVLETFGMSADEAGSMLDALNVVGQQTGLDVGAVADTLSANAAQFEEMGLSAYDAASFLGAASMAGLDTTTAMAGLKKAMQNATKDGLSLDDALSQFEDTMGSNASESEKLTAAYELFGSKAGAAIANAVENGTLDLTDFSSSLGDFEGSVSSTFEGTKGPMDDFQTTLNELKVIGADLVVAAGPLISGVLGPIADGIGAISEVWKGLSPEMQTAIVAIGGIVAAIGPVLSIGGRIMGGISTISGMLGPLAGGVTQTATAAAGAAAPVAAAGGSIGTMAGQALKMIAAAAALWIAAQAISVLVDAAIRITTAGGPAIAVLAGMAVGIGALMGVAAALGPALTAGALGIGVFGAAMLGIGAGIDLACTGIAKVTDAVSGLVETITANADEISSIIETVGESFSGVVETIADGMTTVIDSISGGVSGVLDSVAGIFDSMGDAALNAGTGFEKLANAVINLVSNTGVVDLGATLAAVASGVDKINTSAGGSDSAATKVKALSGNFKTLGTDASGATKNITAFGVSMSAAMLAASASIRTANLAGSMATAINGAYVTASAGISNLRSLFASTAFSFYQHIAVPHFSLSGSFNAETGTVPTVSTSWYAKAAQYGAIFTEPKVIGVGDASQPELLIGTDTLKDMLGSGMQVVNYITVDGAESPEDWANRFARQMQMQARMGRA